MPEFEAGELRRMASGSSSQAPIGGVPDANAPAEWPMEVALADRSGRLQLVRLAERAWLFRRRWFR